MARTINGNIDAEFQRRIAENHREEADAAWDELTKVNEILNNMNEKIQDNLEQKLNVADLRKYRFYIVTFVSSQCGQEGIDRFKYTVETYQEYWFHSIECTSTLRNGFGVVKDRTYTGILRLPKHESVLALANITGVGIQPFPIYTDSELKLLT